MDYLKRSKTQLGNYDVPEQKENTYTVKKLIPEKQDDPEDKYKFETDTSIAINFSFNDPPVPILAPDSGDFSVTTTIPFTFETANSD